MKKPQISRVQPDHHKMFLAGVVVIITLVLLTIMNARLSRQYPEDSLVGSNSITPVSMPYAGKGWKKFVHPAYQFTFVYPSSWTVALTKSSERDRDYALVLTYKENQRNYRVEFMRGGRGASNFDAVVRSTQTYGGHTAYINTYIKDEVPVEEIITFRDMSIIKPYIAIDVQLPKNKNADYKAVVDRIASSIQPTK